MFFQNPKKGREDWYFYLMGIVLVIFMYIIGQLPLTMVALNKINNNQGDLGSNQNDFINSLDFSLLGIDSNFGFFLALLIFVFAFVGLCLALILLHKRSVLSLISWSEKIDWKRLLWSFSFWIFISLGFELLFYLFEPHNYTFQPPGRNYILLILISLFILPIQTSFEELFFRGYLMQGIGFASKNKWIPLIMTTLLFTLVHTMNPEIKEYGLLNMLPYYLIAGSFLAYITIMDNRLELALGVHFATNLFGALIVTYEGAALQTETLFKTHNINPLLLGAIFLLFAVLFIQLASKRFKWDKTSEVFNRWEEKADESSFLEDMVEK